MPANSCIKGARTSTAVLAPGGTAEAAHDEHLDDHGQDQDRGQADREAEDVADPGKRDETEGQDGRRRPEVTLREVHDLVEPVDQAESDGDERAEQAEHHAVQPDSGGHGEQP
jgi:hypothetical protein